MKGKVKEDIQRSAKQRCLGCVASSRNLGHTLLRSFVVHTLCNCVKCAWVLVKLGEG